MCLFVRHMALVALFSKLDSHLLSQSTHSFMTIGNVDKGKAGKRETRLKTETERVLP